MPRAKNTGSKIDLSNWSEVINRRTNASAGRVSYSVTHAQKRKWLHLRVGKDILKLDPAKDRARIFFHDEDTRRVLFLTDTEGSKLQDNKGHYYVRVPVGDMPGYEENERLKDVSELTIDKKSKLITFKL